MRVSMYSDFYNKKTGGLPRDFSAILSCELQEPSSPKTQISTSIVAIQLRWLPQSRANETDPNTMNVIGLQLTESELSELIQMLSNELVELKKLDS